MSSSRLARTIGCAAWALALSTAAHAQTPASPPDDLRTRFPASSIDSVQKADEALAATSGAKERIDKAYKATAKACFGKVLVNNCLDAARDDRRHQVADIDAIELEANRFKRAEHQRQVDADRARRDAEREAKAPADAEERARNRTTYDQKQADLAKSAAEKAQSDANRKTRKPSAAGAKAPSTTEERAKNAASFQHKQQEAVEHQKDLDRRLVEKEADRKRRAEVKAAKDAKDKAAADAANKAVTPPSSQPKP
jgi:hypothetical protein